MGRKKPYNIGEKVLVADPQVFIRCGYPLGISDGIQAVETDYEDKVIGFLRNISSQSTKMLPSRVERKACKNIMKELAVVWLHQRKFGGNLRAIHTEDDTRVTEGNSPYEIATIRYVKTGLRDSGSVYDSMSPEDYEGPSLYDQKTHRILGLVDPGEIYSCVLFEIEDIHVTKI